MSDNALVNFLILGLATARLTMTLLSFELPAKLLNIVKETKSDCLRIILAKTGMFLDCTACLSLLAGAIVLVANSLNHIINVLLAISALGLFIKRKL